MYASSFEEVSGSEESCGYEESSTPATASQSNSFDEADSADSTPAPITGVPDLVADKPNWWCVEGQFKVYTDAKLSNYKGVMTGTLTLERRVLTGCLPTMPAIHALFTRHRLEWMALDVG